MSQEGFHFGAIVGSKSTVTIVATLITVSATAWYLVAGQAGQMSDMVTGLAQVGNRMPNDASVPVFMTMWLTMMVAMMFPTITPMVLAHRMVVRHRGEGLTSTVAFIGGYLAIWTAIGLIPLAAFLGFGALPVDSTSLDWLYRLAGGIVILAGVYQFTPLKETCLSACRTPLRFIMSHDFSSGSQGAIRAGISHGAFCVGCCWALMSVLVAVGLMNLAWMAGLAVIFLLEKNWRYGVAVKQLVGAGLALIGVLIVVRPDLLMGISGGSPSRSSADCVKWKGTSMATVETASKTATKWLLKGIGYEFCNCNPGCTCNFSGFPSSSDGSCKAFVGTVMHQGKCGDVDLSGVTAAAVIDWPKAIHDGNGKAVFIVPPSVTDEQLGALAQIFTGKLGGMPWEILGTTFEVAGVVREEVKVTEAGRHSSIDVQGGIGEARGDTLKNPVTGEDQIADIVLGSGFIWKTGQCGVGSFRVDAGGLKLEYANTNWIHYDFDWSN